MSATLQRDFADAVIDAGRAVPHGVTAYTGATAKRFAVYRNNVVVGLVDALRTRFPVVEAIIGEECFLATAHAFATEHPPASPLMMFYGDGLPDALAEFPHLAELPYLADVARLEAARTHAYHAADAAVLDPKLLQGLEAERLFGLRLTLHPALRIISSQYPIVTMWAMNSGALPLGSVAALGPEDALVTRPASHVEVRALPPGAVCFLDSLAAGQTLGQSAEATLTRQADFDLAATLAILIGTGAIAGHRPAGAPPMTDVPVQSAPPPNTMAMLVHRTVAWLDRIPHAAVALVARLGIAGVFFQSGQTKVDGWRLSNSAIELFRVEYQLPLIDPAVAAYLAAVAEHAFPVLLVAGLATRFAATALLGMTLVIQIFVYPDAWPTHATWAGCLLLLMARGPGALSLDHLLFGRNGRT